MRHPILSAGLIELLDEGRQREKHRLGAISTHDLVFRGALRVEAGMEGETIDRIAALIESTRALSGVLASKANWHMHAVLYGLIMLLMDDVLGPVFS